MTTETETNAHAGERFDAIVNRQQLPFRDPVPDARQILNKADFMPADECILIRVLAHGTRAIGLDETVDLREPGTETFWAFKADRIYRFTVEERGFDWGAGKIKEPLLREIAHVGEDEVFFLEREGHPDRELGPDDEVDLAHAGTEHLRIKKQLVTVFFKNKPYRLSPGTYTTEQLMAEFPIEEGYLLNLKNEQGELVTLQPGQKTTIKNGMHFYSQVPGGGSS
jgi:hypothetical protein